MLNGKFFTGLPPNMIDRGSGGGTNRMESHIFWPDETQVDNAVESRIKRRNSVQLANTERPLYEKQPSVAGNDVDTKKRFSREFSQSSIQFHDNLNDNRSNSRRSMLRNSVGNKKMEIAEKPTKTKLELPESVVDEAYTTAKKKQAYTSTIEFYDYDNEREEPQNNRNNLRKPKMDMNDKREMELNTKNSPKLQVKRDVRSLSEEKEQRKINNREVRAMQRPDPFKMNDSYDREQEREMILNNEERYLQSRRSVEPRMNVSPKRGLAKTTNNYEQRYSSERENFREPAPLLYERRKPAYYENSKEMRDYRRDAATPELYENHRFSQRELNLEDDSHYRREREEPKRIIHNYRMRNLHLKSPPTRKQYYAPEEYYDDEPQQQQQHYYGRNDQIKTPTNRGSSHQRFDYNDREANEVDLPYENNNSSRRFNNNNSPINKINNQIQQKPAATPTSPSPSDAESYCTTKSQKHLRSSLCFNEGAIIGENDATRSPTSTSSSQQYPTQRRNARSSATQRVSVGLPD
ncbi:nuclear transcription factor Y subunit beta [Calliphora vicina]|uniref:nuclear transcription factor Y subunit beta n=1 Tax=Calliphora vicina TaxID=7373 RepID=UPI00325A4651